ncbi:hypothetical protein PPL_09029 [Heterostelium album PN500]|uniref:Uncharacterized protein n=1 Tax=Heterostelium pallidum (strain ATCC 26659 / Pp 5 / PN500) TaxID=670386 RepID=D3BKE8_HETP5|nr:hypothetical protein PPL_09029 [Heterostelium album PN500]EFA78378.1 hypothetical protein PPL_09029 [Heterostelium album PN500]|eukprot:XP_020430503.1 hypothetical protein PPL_09029 [Heterostelium album PN500]
MSKNLFGAASNLGNAAGSSGGSGGIGAVHDGIDSGLGVASKTGVNTQPLSQANNMARKFTGSGQQQGRQATSNNMEEENFQQGQQQQKPFNQANNSSNQSGINQHQFN